MYPPEKIIAENPEGSKPALDKPGMYLIALRAHLSRGKTMLGDVLDSVADALPNPAKSRRTDEA